jgi:hypothetical protein
VGDAKSISSGDPCSDVFEKREVRTLPNLRRDDLWNRLWDWWSQRGFQLSKTGSYRFHGSSFHSNIGLRREFDLALSEDSAGTTVDLNVNAKITDEGMVLGAVSAVVFWPAAVVGGALSYTEYESDAANLMRAFWQYLDSHSTPGTATARRVPVAAKPCEGCGSAMLPEWKVCPHCGRPRTTR